MKKVEGHVATTVNTANAGSMAAGVAGCLWEYYGNKRPRFIVEPERR